MGERKIGRQPREREGVREKERERGREEKVGSQDESQPRVQRGWRSAALEGLKGGQVKIRG